MGIAVNLGFPVSSRRTVQLSVVHRFPVRFPVLFPILDMISPLAFDDRSTSRRTLNSLAKLVGEAGWPWVFASIGMSQSGSLPCRHGFV